MILSEDKTLACKKQLIQCSSICSTERITAVHRDTIMKLLVNTGKQYDCLSPSRIVGLSIKNVQCDEIWAFIGQKEKTKYRLGDDNIETLGDTWTFVAIEHSTKLVLAWHLGRRTTVDTKIFIEKLAYATKGHFQVNTDGFVPYRDAIDLNLGTHVDFGQIIKH